MSSEIPSINIRASMLSYWNDCPRRGAASATRPPSDHGDTPYIRELIEAAGYQLVPSRRNISAAIGTGVHAGAAHTLKEKKEARTVKVEDAVEVSIEKLKSETARGVEFDETSKNLNTAEKQVMTIASVYHRDIAPSIAPVDVERRLEGTVEIDGLNVMVSGHPDVTTEAPAIRDTKTGKNVNGCCIQLGAYHILKVANTENRDYSGKLFIDHLPRVPVSKPYPGATTIELKVMPSVFEAKAVIKAIAGQVKAFIKDGNPQAFPANPCTMFCSEKYCPVYGSKFCEAGKI